MTGQETIWQNGQEIVRFILRTSTAGWALYTLGGFSNNRYSQVASLEVNFQILIPEGNEPSECTSIHLALAARRA